MQLFVLFLKLKGEENFEEETTKITYNFLKNILF